MNEKFVRNSNIKYSEFLYVFDSSMPFLHTIRYKKNLTRKNKLIMFIY